MHSTQREQLILKLLGERGFIGFQELDQILDASPATIRRDLERMAATGQLERIRGGARLAITQVETLQLAGAPFHENIGLHSSEKAKIGRAAAAMCATGGAIIIDGGSTTLQMCPHLDGKGLQVLTNSLHIVSALLPQSTTRVSVPAGTLFREQNIILSPFDDDGMKRFHASKLFMGAASLGHRGLMQADTLLVQAERRLFALADEIIVLVDSSKFAAMAGHLVIPLEDIDQIITDQRITDADRSMVERADIKLVIAT